MGLELWLTARAAAISLRLILCGIVENNECDRTRPCGCYGSGVRLSAFR